MTCEVLAASAQETFRLGERLGRIAPVGACMALDGLLGAGKTQLVRGIAAGAGIADISLVCSPTYCLLNIYPADPARAGSKTVYHLDAYRVRDAEAFAAVGFDELLGQGGLVVLEWACRVPELLPADHLAITGLVEDESRRRWVLKATGPATQRWLAKLHGDELA